MMDNKPRILIVEEEPYYRNFLYRTLSKTYSVDIAQRGPEALDLLTWNTFEVILFDPRMPGRPGKRLVQGILETANKETILIGISGFERHYVENKRAVDPFFNYFIKGKFSPKTLRQTVKEGIVYQQKTLKEDLAPKEKRHGNKLRPFNKSAKGYQRLFEQSLIGIYMLEKDIFIYVNSKLSEILGYSPNELEGQRWQNFITPVPLDEYYPLYSEQLKSASPFEEVELKTRKGEIKNAFHCSSSFEGHEKQYVQGYIIDISGWKDLNRQLLQHQKTESIGTLVSGIAHEFNNILAAMLPQAELIAQHAEEMPNLQRSSQILLTMGEKATRLTRQLLNMSRKTTTEKIPVHVNTWIKESVSFFSSTVEKPNPIEIDLDPRLSYIEADPHQLDLVLFNLFHNACDAMPEGGAIKISTLRNDSPFQIKSDRIMHQSRAEILIRDRGCGIPKENLSKIFDPFFTTKEAGAGTGLGLSVAYNIIKQLDGQIHVQSEIGQGSIFKIVLPHIPTPKDRSAVTARLAK